MIYLDHAATTPLDKDVLNEMLPFFSEDFGNANSQHTYGQKAASAVIKAREEIAECLNAKPSEIYFTSGGTEAEPYLPSMQHKNATAFPLSANFAAVAPAPISISSGCGPMNR